MVSGEDIKIPARGSSFGNYINASHRFFVDDVQTTKDGILVLSNVERSAETTLPELKNLDSIKSLYYLDISKRAVIAEKTIYCDRVENVLREIDAKPPF
jgi:hypothetical protein